MDETEIRVALHWEEEEEDVRVAEIARRLGRIWSSFCRIFGDVRAMKVGVGRRAKLTEEDKGRLVNMVEGIVEKADTRHTITAHMLQFRFTTRVSLRVLPGALQCML